MARTPYCPFRDPSECSMARERAVAGKSNVIPPCPKHGAFMGTPQSLPWDPNNPATRMTPLAPQRPRYDRRGNLIGYS